MKRLSAFRRREAWVGGLTRRPRLPLPRIRILETYYVLLKRYVFNRFLSICYSNVVFHAVLSKGCSNIVLHANHILLLYYIILYYAPPRPTHSTPTGGGGRRQHFPHTPRRHPPTARHPPPATHSCLLCIKARGPIHRCSACLLCFHARGGFITPPAPHPSLA